MFKWIVTILLLLFIYHVREVFPPFIVGAIFAYLLYPAIKVFHERLKMPPLLAASVLYLGTLMMILYGAWKGVPMLADEASKLYANREETVVGFLNQINNLFHLGLDVQSTAEQILDGLSAAVGKPEELVHVGGLISQSLLSGLVCVLTSIYLLIDSRRVGRFFLRFIPSERRSTVVSLMSQMDVIFRRYVLGQLFLIALMSCVGFAILSAFGVKYALLLAIMAGCLEIIPVLGPAIVYTVIVVFTFSQYSIATAGGVLGCFLIARLVEDYLIVPNTVGHAVELHPLATVFAVLVGEHMAGALGMLIAIPVAAALKVVIDFCYPAVHTEGHHRHQNPIETLLIFLGIKKSPHSQPNAQMRADAEAIEFMHEGSAGVRVHHSTASRSDEQPTSIGKVARKEAVTPEPTSPTHERQSEPPQSIHDAVQKVTASTPKPTPTADKAQPITRPAAKPEEGDEASRAAQVDTGDLTPQVSKKGTESAQPPSTSVKTASTPAKPTEQPQTNSSPAKPDALPTAKPAPTKENAKSEQPRPRDTEAKPSPPETVAPARVKGAAPDKEQSANAKGAVPTKGDEDSNGAKTGEGKESTDTEPKPQNNASAKSE